MRHNFYKSLLFIALLAASNVSYADAVMKQGAWKMNMKMLVQTEKNGAYKEAANTTVTYCLSQAFIDKDPYLKASVDAEKMKAKNAKCTISDEKRVDNTASWKINCEMVGGIKAVMAVENAVSETEFTSQMQNVIHKNGSDAQTKTEVKGTFEGECTKEMLTL